MPGRPGIAQTVKKLVAQDARRTSNSVFRLRCCERPDVATSGKYPVKLIVFDFDETLTLVTLMTPDGTYLPEQKEWAKLVNFETPWVPGSRVVKLQKMFNDLAHGKDGEKRCLTILTRNGNASGVAAVVNLLKAANLDTHFSAIWTLPYRHGRRNGAYQEDGQWSYFDPPVTRGVDHKADVLVRITENPKAWFPQLGGEHCPDAVRRLSAVALEEVVLVDDQRANFQSETGTRVLRYAKVARYDAEYREFGLMRDMGGIGAHDDADYDALKRFVEDPWMCKESFQVRCQERDFEGQEKKLPVSLVVFDFDETLTLATFMPDDPGFARHIGWSPHDNQWSSQDLVEYNFETPWVGGSRVAKLRQALKAIISPVEGGKRIRTLAVLTRNEHGVVAVLNLLTMAGLADLFSAIWTIPARQNAPNGTYREESGTWKPFDPPVAAVNDHKADVLHHVAQNPTLWFPQLVNGEDCSQTACLDRLRVEGIVLVDDERANFRSLQTEAMVLRYCKVARYDENYRDCGTLNQLGGIGAHSDDDYEQLRTFIERPWDFPYEGRERTMQVSSAGSRRPGTNLSKGPSERSSLDPHKDPTVPNVKDGAHGGEQPSLRNRSNSNSDLHRENTDELAEPPKAPRVRKGAALKSSTSGHTFGHASEGSVADVLETPRVAGLDSSAV